MITKLANVNNVSKCTHAIAFWSRYPHYRSMQCSMLAVCLWEEKRVEYLYFTLVRIFVFFVKDVVQSEANWQCPWYINVNLSLPIQFNWIIVRNSLSGTSKRCYDCAGGSRPLRHPNDVEFWILLYLSGNEDTFGTRTHSHTHTFKRFLMLRSVIKPSALFTRHTVLSSLLFSLVWLKTQPVSENNVKKLTPHTSAFTCRLTCVVHE